MQALLIIAHGSRRAESNTEIETLTAEVARRAASKFDLVECAFLELAVPLIPDGINELVERGAKSIVVVPYFLAKGAHVKEDIPEAIQSSQADHPDIPITVSTYFGAAEPVPDLLAQLALSATGEATVDDKSLGANPCGQGQVVQH